MKILVLSCDRNEDTFEAFHHCMEKYGKGHPKIYYMTETIVNPYYTTINKNYPLEQWTKRLRETLQEINDDHILIMIDDCFIRKNVDKQRIKYCDSILKDNIALINFEKSFDENDLDCEYDNIKKRCHGAAYEVSILCGLWQKDKLLQVISKDSDPGTVEYTQPNCGFDYYINAGDYIIDGGYETGKPTGIFKGKWCRNTVSFMESEGIEIDYSKKGFYD